MPDLIAINDISTTGSTGLRIIKQGVSSTGEIVLHLGVSDDPVSFFRVTNARTTDAQFASSIQAYNSVSNASPGLSFVSYIGSVLDSGTSPGFAINTALITAAALATRPPYDFQNGGVSALKLLADGSMSLKTLLKFALTGLTAERTFTFPDSSGAVVSEAATQTLTNKTLTTPTINGSKMADPATKTGAYTLTATDSIIKADASASGFTLTLPGAATAGAGTTYTIIRTDTAFSTNALTIDANSTELINGNLTYTLWTGESITIECDGTGWQCINQPHPMGLMYAPNKGATANRRYIAGLAETNETLLTSTTGPVVNLLYAMPLIVPRTTKFDTICMEVTTGGAGSNCRLGIYYDNGNCYPGALIFDSGNLATTGTGEKAATITAGLQTFNPGLYWLTYENSATVPQVRILPGAGGQIPILGHTTPFGANLPATGYTVAHTVGALPNPYSAGGAIRTLVSGVGNGIPAVALRAV